jgi:hypothetical protein
MGDVGLEKRGPNVGGPNGHVLKTKADSKRGVDQPVVIVLNQLVHDHAAHLEVITIAAREENTVKFTELVQSNFRWFTPNQWNDSGASFLNKFDVCCHQVRVIPIETGVAIKVRVKRLGENADDRLLICVNVSRGPVCILPHRV